MTGAALTLFTVATRTAHFFIMHEMCYEIRGDHVTNFPIATIHFELIKYHLSADGCCYEHLITCQLIDGLALYEGSADMDDLKKKRHRRAPEPCTQLGCPTCNHKAAYKVIHCPLLVRTPHKPFS